MEEETRKPNSFVKWLSTMNARCRIADFAVIIHKAGDRKSLISIFLVEQKDPSDASKGIYNWDIEQLEDQVVSNGCFMCAY